MLYFSETGWTLPDMAEVKATFDRDYNQRRYERKIAGLIRQIRATQQEGDKSALRAWDEAVRRIWDEDHYLLVMIDQASRPGMSLGHIARLGAMVLAGTAIMLVAVWFFMFR